VRLLFASTRGAGHFNPMVPYIDACVRGGHDVLVVGPPQLAETVERAGYPFRLGFSPPEEELGAVWARVPTVPTDEAERIVIGTIFATLNVRAMVPALRATVEEWRPDMILREPAEFASAVVAEETGVPHVQVAAGLVSSHMELLSIAHDAVEAWGAGLTERIVATPYLTTFPVSLEDPDVQGPPTIRRFRAPEPPTAPLPDWWPGDDRPLVYVSFGSVAATVPPAARIYGIALEAVADLPARVLLTTGPMETPLSAPAPNVHIERWVPQADVLPEARAVVCHGGSGTTLGALAAGVPLVITPLFADQPQNARRVAATGAGIHVQGHEWSEAMGAVDPAALHDAIATVLTDDVYAEAAQRIAAEIRELPPVDTALTVLQPEAA
jgi:UDP:flavonoid glycosyltransferase YjiC (YdhE family)